MVKEFLDIGDALDDISLSCLMSEFQYLDKMPRIVELSEDSGTECQDFIYYRGVPLVSENLKKFFDLEKVDYLFFKKIILKKTNVGLEETYWLALPERINCLNRDKSNIDDFLNVADRICIDADKIGRYKIFKLAGVNNNEIIVTEDFAEKLKEKRFVGLHIYELK